MPHNTMSGGACQADPMGRPCDRVATHTVTLPPTRDWDLTGRGLAPDTVPVCESHVGEWVDPIPALAVLL